MKHDAETVGDKPAVIFEGRTVTWSELWDKVQKGAASIAGRLNSPNQEVVAILLPNSIEFIEVYLSIVHSGHIASPLDPAYKSLELNAILDQIPHKLLITDAEYSEKIDPVQAQNTVAATDIFGSANSGELLRLKASEQIASLTFTSGTTGLPKSVPYTHDNHIWNIKVCSQVWDWTSEDSHLITVPLGHFNGAVMALSGAVYHGNTMYLQRWFDEASTLEALASGKITMFNQAASAYVKLVAHPKSNYDLSKVRLCTSGAAPLPPPVWREFKERYGIEILETYGSSETGRIAGNKLDERRRGSPGKPLPGVNLRLSAEGEVQIKSKGVFPGYYLNPEATEAARTSDGFWRTGDIAELRDGYVYIRGRVQERIRRFGYTISPRDVEWAMHKHPKVNDIYVMGQQLDGQPDDKMVYFIVSSLSDDEIKEYCKANLLFAWRPDQIVRLDELPRTRSGKVKIGELKAMAQ